MTSTTPDPAPTWRSNLRTSDQIERATRALVAFADRHHPDETAAEVIRRAFFDSLGGHRITNAIQVVSDELDVPHITRTDIGVVWAMLPAPDDDTLGD